MNTTKICPQCGNEFVVNSRHPNVIYCSHRCHGDSRKLVESRRCIVCDTEFKCKPANDKKCCSVKCATQARAQNRLDPSKHATFTCKQCGKQFDDWLYRQPTFCSNHCRSVYAAHQPKLSSRKPRNFVTLRCEVCDREYVVHKSQIENRNSRYCSNECRYKAVSEQKRGAGNPNFRGGTIAYRGANWGTQSRKALKRDGYCCQICHKRLGRRGWDYGVHHIKPYREFNGDYETANQLSNLITLCRSCHGKVEWGGFPCPIPLL